MLMVRVAICDDDAVAAKELSRYITRYYKGECKVFIYNGATEILQSEAFYDYIMLDIELLDGSGIEVASRIRRYDKRVPIIFITNYENYIMHSFDVHPFEYILKPIMLSDTLESGRMIN